MSEPPSPTVGGERSIEVVGADEQHDVDLDVDRWCRLAHDVLRAEGRGGELTLTFVDRDEITELNAEHMGQTGPTDVLSFPLDGDAALDGDPTVPTLLGDVVVCPAVAARNAADHVAGATEAHPGHPRHDGSLAAELDLLVVHGVLHLLGHDHGQPDERERMLAAERSVLAPPAGDDR